MATKKSAQALRNSFQQEISQKSKEFGEKLQSLRVKADFSQREVAEKLGYKTPQFVSNWERGVSQPPVKTLLVIAKMYGVDPESLANEAEELYIEQTRLQFRSQWVVSGVRL